MFNLAKQCEENTWFNMPYQKSGYNPTPYDNQALMGSKAISAATYTQEEILLPNMPEGILPGILRISVQMEQTKYLDAAGDYIGFHLSPKSQDDLIKIGDPDCIACSVWENKGVGVEEECLIKTFDFPAPMKISFKKLYLGLKGTHAQTISYRIDWVPRNSNVPQRDNLVSQLQF